jgi:hypothetical protein
LAAASSTRRSRSAAWRESPNARRASKQKLRGLSLTDTQLWRIGRRCGQQGLDPADRPARQRGVSRRVAGNLVIKALAEIAGVSSDVTASPIAGWSPMPPNDAVVEAPLRHVYKPLPHDSGAKHVQGAAEYIDDIPEPVGTLHVAVGGAPVARGTIRRIDLSEVQNAPGVVAVITAAHIPGKNDISPASADEPVFAYDRIDFHSQPVFAVIATTRDAARRAALRGKIESDAEKPNVSVEQGKASGERVLPDYAFINGDAAKAAAEAPFAARERFASAARSTFIWKARWRLRCPARTAPSWSIRPPSIRAKCSTSSPGFWRCRIRS